MQFFVGNLSVIIPTVRPKSDIIDSWILLVIYATNIPFISHYYPDDIRFEKQILCPSSAIPSAEGC